MLVLFFAVLAAVTSGLKIDQSSVISWEKNNLTKFIIFQNIQYQSSVYLQKIGSLPYYSFSKSGEGPNTYEFDASSSADIYRPSSVLHLATIAYAYQNGDSSVISSTVSLRNGDSAALPTSAPASLFNMSLMTDHPSPQFGSSLFMVLLNGSTSSVYEIGSDIYSNETKCNTLSLLNESFLQSNGDCHLITPQQIIQNSLYKSAHKQHLQHQASVGAFLPFKASDLFVDIQILEPANQANNLLLQSLSQVKMDVQLISLSARNVLIQGNQKMEVNITNEGRQIIYLHLYGAQGFPRHDYIYEDYFIMKPQQTKYILMYLSIDYPAEDILIGAINVMNEQYKEFFIKSTPIAANTTTNTTTNATTKVSNIKANQQDSKSGDSLAFVAFSVIGWAIIMAIIICLCVNYRNRKSKNKSENQSEANANVDTQKHIESANGLIMAPRSNKSMPSIEENLGRQPIAKQQNAPMRVVVI